VKTITVKFPKSGDIIYEPTEGFTYDLSLVLIADKKQRYMTELLPTGKTITTWYGTHSVFIILCPSEK
jgi:hypothetical protein